jgi:hypothetical protein
MELLVYMLKSAGVLAIFYLVYVLLLRSETHFKAHRVYLLLGLAGSFLLPLFYFYRTVYIDPPAATEGLLYANLIEPGSAMVSEPSMSIDWWTIALIIYSTGLLLVFTNFIYQLRRLLLLLKSNKTRRSHGFIYVQVSEPIAPFSFFQYIVYNPELHSECELEMILQHEQVHAFQWHSADIILANLLVVLQWANPFAWLYKKSVEENLEFLADNSTVSRVPSKKDYQIALVRASSARQIPALTTNFYKSFIKKRIIMLNKSTSKRHNVLKVAAVLPLLALFLLGFNVKENIAYNELPSQTNSSYSETDNRAILKPSDKVVRTIVATPIERNTDKIAASPTSEQITQHSGTPALVIATPGNPVLKIHASGKEVRFTITKNTSDAELLKMKEVLKREHGIDLSYTTVRNPNNEITSISIQYSGDGRNGNYSIQDDEAIEDFVFYINENGESGFWSERAEERREARDAYRVARLKESEGTREELRNRREVMRKEMDERRKEMDEKRKEIREKMREKRTEIIDDDGEKVIIIDDDDDNEVEQYIVTRRMDDKAARQDRKIAMVEWDRDRARANHQRSGHHIVIEKNTSDADLAELKQDLADEGITMKYSKLRRNSKGELTRIKIEVVTSNSKQTSTAEGDDGEPIGQLVIDLDR